jgi:hypothetical protein
MTTRLSSHPFYSDNVRLPHPEAPTPPEIMSNSRLYPFFKDAMGAVDGCKFRISRVEGIDKLFMDYHGLYTQNTLIACTFDMNVIYAMTGWEGSSPDAEMYHKARLVDLPIPPGKFFFADAGFPPCDTLIVPYRGVRYGLNETSSDPALRSVHLHLYSLEPI